MWPALLIVVGAIASLLCFWALKVIFIWYSLVVNLNKFLMNGRLACSFLSSSLRNTVWSTSLSRTLMARRISLVLAVVGLSKQTYAHIRTWDQNSNLTCFPWGWVFPCGELDVGSLMCGAWHDSQKCMGHLRCSFVAVESLSTERTKSPKQRNYLVVPFFPHILNVWVFLWTDAGDWAKDQKHTKSPLAKAFSPGSPLNNAVVHAVLYGDNDAERLRCDDGGASYGLWNEWGESLHFKSFVAEGIQGCWKTMNRHAWMRGCCPPLMFPTYSSMIIILKASCKHYRICCAHVMAIGVWNMSQYALCSVVWLTVVLTVVYECGY